MFHVKLYRGHPHVGGLLVIYQFHVKRSPRRGWKAGAPALCTVRLGAYAYSISKCAELSRFGKNSISPGARTFIGSNVTAHHSNGQLRQPTKYVDR